MRIVYAGTPEYVVPPLDAVLNAGHDVPLVVTPPDVASGRGQSKEAPALKKEALKRGLHVYQPESINDDSAVERLSSENPDVLIVASFGRILDRQVLEVPEIDAINIHPSCLPAYRGPAPVAHAILDGKQKTCVTIFRMNEKMDRGPIIEQEETRIKPGETTENLRERLFSLGGDLLPDVLERLKDGSVSPREQRHEDGSYAPFLSRDDGRIDWTKSADYIFRQVRAMKPWPTTFSWLDMSDRTNPLRMKIVRGFPDEENGSDVRPGTITGVAPEGITVRTGSDDFVLERVQPENKKEMEVKDFINGYQPEPGDRFVQSPDG